MMTFLVVSLPSTRVSLRSTHSMCASTRVKSYVSCLFFFSISLGMGLARD
jgi:hypothetical protein